ncbi:gelsolin-like protein 2 isoform X2 [Mytilus californianus]|uniref:gelsolin-like protein 2 isoform X2 n=1 Tax=Mytilus californianus TaxID=6549 RepID=UPI0022482552|nr:gelsolin-like protein 2 isoform X2 [Mytilus californianus]
MTGLVKAKKYDWKDSNMALFGTDVERQVKKESAMGEPAWEGAGQSVGLKIWRVVKFQITDWQEEDYGKFFDGDSYIILNTYKKNEDSEELCYDLHFWIGKHSTQDEYGTAAYKTVELDTFLDDAAVQHREVMGHESTLFKSYFKSITTMQGGAETGFKHVLPEEYRPRLLHFSGKRRIEVKEVPYKRSSLNSGDVYVLDLGMQIYQWNGAESSGMERIKAAEYLQQMESERPKASTTVLDESGISKAHRFYEAIPEGDADEVDSDDEDEGDDEKKLLRLSDAGGSINFSEVKTGDVAMEDLGEDDVFVLDTKSELFVWVGGKASVDERRNGMGYAHKYLMDKARHYKPVSVVSEKVGKDRIEVALSA